MKILERFLSLALTVCLILSLAAVPAGANKVTVSNQANNPYIMDFENGDNEYGYGTIVQDPTNAANHVLDFSGTNSPYTGMGKSASLKVNTIEYDFYYGQSGDAISLRLKSNNKYYNLGTIHQTDEKNWFRFLNMNYGWINSTELAVGKWYSVKMVFDKENTVVYNYFGEKGTPLKSAGQGDITNSSNLSAWFNTNNVDVMMTETNLTDKTIKTYYDNIIETAYLYPYEAVNQCSTAAEVEDEINEYASLGVFDKGDYEALAFKDGFYDNFLNRSYESTAALQTEYTNLVNKYKTYSDGKTVHYVWNFEQGKLKTTNDKGDMNGYYDKGTEGSDGYAPYVLKADPTNSLNTTAYIDMTKPFNFVNTEVSMKDNAAASDYIIVDWKAYREVPLVDGGLPDTYGNIDMYYRINNNGLDFFIMTNWNNGNFAHYVGGNNTASQDSFNKNHANNWITMRNIYDLNNHTYSLNIYANGQWNKIWEDTNANIIKESTANNHFGQFRFMQGNTTDKLGGIYFDDMSISSYNMLYSEINAARNAKSVELILNNFKEMNLFTTPAILDTLDAAGKTAVYTALASCNDLSSDAEVTATIEEECGKVLVGDTDTELVEYDRVVDDSTGVSYMTSIDVIINKADISGQSANFVVAEYDGNELESVKILPYNGSLARYTKVSLTGLNINANNSDSIKIMLIDSIDDINPLTKALEVIFAKSFTVQSDFFPGHTKKAVSVTLDDGDLTADGLVIAELKKAGIKGTFNLMSNTITQSNKQSYIDTYDGFEIANHVKYHAYSYEDNKSSKTFKTEPVTRANNISLYVLETDTNGTGQGYADEANYIKCVDQGKSELEAVFGTDTVKSFVWPGGGAGSYTTTLVPKLKAEYKMIRVAAPTDDTNTFDLPVADENGIWYNWKYTADHNTIASRTTAFADMKIADNEPWQWFCLGVHSWQEHVKDGALSNDFKNMVLTLGNKPGTYWYAGTVEIHDYTEAVKDLVITEKSVTNPTDITLYIKINGIPFVIAPNETITKAEI